MVFLMYKLHYRIRMLSEHDGKFLLEVARETIKRHVNHQHMAKPEEYPAALDEKRGVFCTIKNEKGLRGCIGIPYPVMPLMDAMLSAAASACEDSRFPSLTVNELKGIKIEISVLTEPELVKEPMKKGSIKIGRDGLIIQHGRYSGLLLPQVATEQEWGAEEFLEHLCLKAGLPTDKWKDRNAKIYRFQAQIFSEQVTC